MRRAEIKTSAYGQELQEEKSPAKEALDKLTSDVMKLALVIIITSIALIILFYYFHPGVLLGFFVVAPISYSGYKKLIKKNYVVILELDPKNWEPQLYWAVPEFFSKLKVIDEPATLEASQSEVVKKKLNDQDEVENVQIALKGIQNTKDGLKIYVCQEFGPEKGYIYFGWLDGMTPYEWIMDKTKFAQLTAFANHMKEKYADEKSSARSMVVSDIERFIERWGQLPENRRPADRLDLELGGEDGIDRYDR